MPRLPEKGTFESNLEPILVNAGSLVRLSRFPTTEPHWSVNTYRFDLQEVASGKGVGTCYAASCVEAAFAESVLHEGGRFVRVAYEVPLTELKGRGSKPELY